MDNGRGSDNMISQSRRDAILWAREILTPNTLILDTETTGLHFGSEIVQIAVINIDGKPLLDTLVKPRNPIPPDEAIHGITDDMVIGAPTWREVSTALTAMLSLTNLIRNVVIYNAAYDLKMLYSSGSEWGMPKIEWNALAKWDCAMEMYAQFWGDWNDYRASYRWQKLTDACYQQRIRIGDAPAHSALGDCLRTLALVRHVASAEDGGG